MMGYEILGEVKEEPEVNLLDELSKKSTEFDLSKLTQVMTIALPLINIFKPSGILTKLIIGGVVVGFGLSKLKLKPKEE